MNVVTNLAPGDQLVKNIKHVVNSCTALCKSNHIIAEHVRFNILRVLVGLRGRNLLINDEFSISTRLWARVYADVEEADLTELYIADTKTF